MKSEEDSKIKLHCNRCDDTGIVYKVVRARGSNMKYIQLPCPDCVQMGLNSGTRYVDEKFTQLSMFHDVVKSKPMGFLGGMSMEEYITKPNIIDEAARQYTDAKALEEFYGLVLGEIYMCGGKECKLVGYSVEHNAWEFDTILKPQLTCNIIMLDDGSKESVSSRSLKKRTWGSITSRIDVPRE